MTPRRTILTVCLVLVGFISKVCGQADSLLLRAALAGDAAAWREVTAAPGGSPGVWAPFVDGARSEWLPASDSAQWLLARWAAPMVAYSLRNAPDDVIRFTPPTPARSSQPWPFWALGGALALAVVAITLRRSGLPTTTLPAELVPVDAWLRAPAADRENGAQTSLDAARTAWLNWSQAVGLGESPASGKVLADFSLTSTEREVAECILRGLTAQEIADQLKCTPSHVYNVRSRVRKKLDLKSDEPLDRQIKAFVMRHGASASEP